MTKLEPRPLAELSVKNALVDGDIHIQPPARSDLGRYMSQRWQHHLAVFGQRGRAGANYPRANADAARTDSWPPNGKPPGSDLDFLRAQLLDAWHISIGVLNPLLGPGNQQNLEFGAALASAVNDWQLAEWTRPEPRLRGSVVVETEDGEFAAREIHRVGDHPSLVHVLLHIRTAEPLGRRKYWPLYQAAVDHGLPVAIHFGGSGGGPTTGAGYPSFYIEDHAGMSAPFQSQLVSMITEGIFERFPDLKIVLIEGGFAWIPPLMWRLDNAYKRLREEVPSLQRLPSEYIRDHVWLTTQPMEEPQRPDQFLRLLGQMDMDDRLMFATDYPHWDFDAPDQAIPPTLDTDRRMAFRAGNADRLYGLGLFS